MIIFRGEGLLLYFPDDGRGRQLKGIGGIVIRWEGETRLLLGK